MIFSRFIARTKSRLAKRNRYNQLVSEIEGMTERDLADINGSRPDMLRHAYMEVYG